MRNLTTFAITAVATLLLGALGASVAAAQQGHLTSDGPVTLTAEQRDEIVPPQEPITLEGTQTGSKGANAITAFKGSIECSSASYTAYKYNVTPHAGIPTGQGKITISPSYGTCSGIGATATIDMNECDYVLELQSTTGTDAYGTKTSIVCPSGKHVKITLFEGEAHTKVFCTLTITEKAEGYSGLTATDSTKGTVNVSGTTKSLEIHKEGEGVLCAEKATTKEAELDLDITLKGSRSIKLTDTGGNGTFTWEENAEHVTINNWWEMFGLKVTCAESSYTGHQHEVTPHEFLPNGSTAITLTPHYNQERCMVGSLYPMTIDMNGCDYTLELGETTGESDTYGVTTGVTCPEAKQIEIKVFTTKAEDPSTPFCTLRIGAQSGLTGLHATDTTAGYLTSVGTASGIHAVRVNHGAHLILCPNNTTTSAMQVHLDLVISGHNEIGGFTEIGLSHE
jgi:hypothetical protein